MKPPRKFQPTPDDLVTSLLVFIQDRFYPGHQIQFLKDRPRLLKWVVLYPATWLNTRGVTLPPARYREIVLTVLQDALANMRATKITYLPAYLKMVLQSHFQHHGDEYYYEGKSARALTDQVLAVAGRLEVQQRDPVRDLAAAATLLKAPRRSRPAPSQQLPLFGS